MTTTTKRAFTVLNMFRGDHWFEVHRTGCRDIARQLSWKGNAQSDWDALAESAEALVADEVAAFHLQEQGFTAHDFKILPCCKRATTTTTTTGGQS